MHFQVAALVATGFAGLTSAFTTPVGTVPSGNPTSRPGLGEIVPVNVSFPITWTPTTSGTVSIVLLHGPSTADLQPILTIAEDHPNNGSFWWSPPSSLAADTTNYGIELIDDSNGQFQFTPPFGISNPSGASVSQPSNGAPTTTVTATSLLVTQTQTVTAAPTTTFVALNSTSTFSTVTPLLNSTTIVGNTTAKATLSPTLSSTTLAQTTTTSNTVSSVTSPAPASSTSAGAASHVAVNAAAVAMGLGSMAWMML